MPTTDVNVAGYFSGVMGVGEHARQLAAALRTQGIGVATTTLHPEAAPEDATLDQGASAPPTGRFNLLCANADSVPKVADELGPGFFADRYTIGFWAWEVSEFPERFLPAFDYLDEVWVGSRHVRDAIAPHGSIPVLAIPQPVSLAPGSERAAPPPGLPDGFRFLFAFDYLSVFERKNPLAVLAAFVTAFPQGSGATLIVKSLNDEHNPVAHERLLAAVGEHADIHLLEQRLTPAARDGLMNAADCYVSLHRAEGFGYTLAEAMWLGKPVVATGYSGNLDYMTPSNSYLVDHRLAPIGPGNDPYPAQGVWAEPDVEHAARLMREVFDNREEAWRRGQRAAVDIRATHAPEVAGLAMAQRLESLGAAATRNRVRRPPQTHPKRVESLLRSEPALPARQRFGVAQRGARKGLLRLLKPVTVHQRRIDEELLRTTETLSANIDSLAAAQAQALERIKRIEDELRGQRE